MSSEVRYRTPGIRTTLVLPAFIQTQLFDKISFPTNPLFRFLAPPVQPHTIVKAIIEALDAHESRTIRLPIYSNLARFMNPGVGLLPNWLIDLGQKVSSPLNAHKAGGRSGGKSGHCVAIRQGTKLYDFGTADAQLAGADHAMKNYGPHPDAAERLNNEKANVKAK
jgi:all-trans-retinol dehydrogenase (NAD+)